MRMYDILKRKRDGFELSEEEIRWFVSGYTAGEIPDYQASAFAMAVCIRGMTARETSALTFAMAASGDTVDLSSIPGMKVDKHSTGGVGDKTTLIAAPIAASLGVKVAKMSGRGLGHTGGTLDKLEAIPGMRTALTREEFFGVVRRVGLSVVGQTGNLVPADKKLYALRDVTATVDSIPLIAASVMSKKLAAGSDRILLDVKTGSGAFMKTEAEALELAHTMARIGEHAGRRTAALITDMDVPLGRAVGNAIEVAEACETLRGRGPEDLTELCTELAACMLFLAERGSLAECRTLARGQIANGQAFAKLKEFVAAQGGRTAVLDDPSQFPRAGAETVVRAEKSGFLSALNAELIGEASVLLGAGREKKEDSVDPAAGIFLLKKTGDRAEQGEPLARLFASCPEKCRAGEELFRSALRFSSEQPAPGKLIRARVNLG